MLRALVVLALALAAGACAGSRTVVPVTMGASVSPMPQSAYELVTHEQAVRGVAAILVRDLRIPVAPRVTVSVYSSRRILEEGPVRDGRVSRLGAAELFLLADHLIRRDGFGRLLEYFRALGTRVDRHANFRAAFGQSPAEFEQEALAHLASAVR